MDGTMTDIPYFKIQIFILQKLNMLPRYCLFGFDNFCWRDQTDIMRVLDAVAPNVNQAISLLDNDDTHCVATTEHTVFKEGSFENRKLISHTFSFDGAKSSGNTSMTKVGHYISWVSHRRDGVMA